MSSDMCSEIEFDFGRWAAGFRNESQAIGTVV